MFIQLQMIVIESRQRTTFDAVKLNELKNSIRTRRRLLNPIIVEPIDDEIIGREYRLICGERRCRAMRVMHEEGNEIFFGDEPIPPDMIPATVITDISLIERLRTEFDENMIREDLTWQDRDRSLFVMHQAELDQNPDATIIDTAKSIMAKGGLSATNASGPQKTLGSVRVAVTQALVVAKHLDDPKIAKARNSNEAYALIMAQEEATINAELYRRGQMGLATTSRPTIEIRQGDATKIVPTLPENSFELICSDPPYGVLAGAKGYRGRTVHHHNYEDSPQLGMDAIKFLLTEGWRVSKPTANIFIFGHVDNWPFFKAQAATMGWKPFIVPIIWQKSKSEGLAPWGKSGFRRTYECIFYAAKGVRGLISSPVDVLSVRRVHRSERIYGAQKPIDLLMQLIECSTLPGEAVLDPFCGSGSTLAAAKRLGRTGLGIELDQSVVDVATNFVFKGEIEDAKSDDNETPLAASATVPAVQASE